MSPDYRRENGAAFAGSGAAVRVMMKTSGRVAEWLMAPVLKTGVPERVSGVRIPPLPPCSLRFSILWPNFSDNPRNSAKSLRT